MRDKDTQLIFEAYLTENTLEPDVMPFYGYEEDLINYASGTPNDSWFEHGGFDDPDDSIDEEHIGVVMLDNSTQGPYRVVFVDLTSGPDSIYHGLTGPLYTEPAKEMDMNELEAARAEVTGSPHTMKRLGDLRSELEITGTSWEDEHYNRGVSPSDFE